MLALSETFGRKEAPDILKKIPGYGLYLSERSGRAKAGGGLAMYYRDTLQAHEWHPNIDEEYKYVESERQWLLINGVGSNKMAFLNCYIACQSFASDNFIQWNQDLFQMLTKEVIYLRQKGFIVLAMGDFNTHVGEIPGLEGNHPDVNRNYSMFTNFLSDSNLVIINTLDLCDGLFTRFKRQQKSLLDYGLIDGDHVQKVNSFKVDTDARFDCMTDHALLECEIEFRTSPKAFKTGKDVFQYNFHDGSNFSGYKTFLETSLSSIQLDDFSRLNTPEMLDHVTKNIHAAALNTLGLKIHKKNKKSSLPKTIRDTIMYKRDVARRLHFSVITKNHEEEKTLQREFDALKTKVDKDISDLRLRKRNKLRAKLIGADPNKKVFWKFLRNQVKSAGSISALLNKVRDSVLHTYSAST